MDALLSTREEVEPIDSPREAYSSKRLPRAILHGEKHLRIPSSTRSRRRRAWNRGETHRRDIRRRRASLRIQMNPASSAAEGHMPFLENGAQAHGWNRRPSHSAKKRLLRLVSKTRKETRAQYGPAGFQKL